MRVRDIAEINAKNISIQTEFADYKYLDTSNLTKNKIDNYQYFEDKNNLPSRAKRLVKDGDILISTVRPTKCHYGYLQEADENLVVSTGFTVLSPNKELVNGRYLYYYLTQDKLTNYFQMIAESAVSSYPSITSDIIANVEITFPEKSVQDTIVTKLEILDEKLKNNTFLLSNLEEYSQLLFHRWFVDFNFPDENGNPYKDARGEMVEVDGKMVPKGWLIKPIKHYVSKSITGDWGVDLPGDNLTESLCIRGADLPNWRCGNTNTTPIRYIDVSKRSEKSMIHGDIMVEISGGSPTQSTGRILNIRDSALINAGKPVFCSNFSKIIRPKKPKYGLYVGLHLQKLYDRGIFFHYESKTTGIKNLLLDRVLNKLTINVPNEEILNNFLQITEPLYDKINQLGAENKLLEETRDLLIKKLIK